MKITFDAPEEIAKALQGQWPEMTRSVLESIALEGYRCGALSDGQLRRLLGFETRFEARGFLKDHGAPLNDRLEDLEADRLTHERLGLSCWLLLTHRCSISQGRR